MPCVPTPGFIWTSFYYDTPTEVSGLGTLNVIVFARKFIRPMIDDGDIAVDTRAGHCDHSFMLKDAGSSGVGHPVRWSNIRVN